MTGLQPVHGLTNDTRISEEIREWTSGNICRCGAYTNIVTAVATAARAD
jgi:aerobic-type carbon monoxide dehydrogenase small subunit (CoxS/CutS family)